jgi:hypothetical protein
MEGVFCPFLLYNIKILNMLLKNGEVYNLTKSDRDQLKKEFKSEALRLVYPEERVRKSREPENRLPDKPKSITFPLTAKRVVNRQTEVWTWCERTYNDEHGNPVHQPSTFSFTGSHLLNDEEQIWWFLNICPYLKGGKNFNNKLPKCEIEDLIKKSDELVDKKAQQAELVTMLYNKQVGLTDSQIRQACKAYFIKGSDKKDISTLKLELESKILANKTDGVQKFKDLMNTPQVVKVRSIIQKSIDIGILYYVIPKKAWYMKSPEGRPDSKGEKVVDVPIGMNEHEAIFEYYMNNGQFAQTLTISLERYSDVPEEVE